MDLSKLPKEFLDNNPLVPPPPGVVSNFIDRVSRADRVRNTTYVFLPFMIVAVVLRLYTRIYIKKRFGWDDYLTIVSALCAAAGSGVTLYVLKGPIGKHIWDLSLSQWLAVPWGRFLLAGTLLYSVTAMFVKLALLALYLRIFDPSQRARIMIWFGIIFILLFYIATLIVYAIVGRFRLPVDQGPLKVMVNTNVVQGVVGLLTDLYILFIPLHLVLGLNLPLGRKIGVCAIFLSGLIACVCAGVGAYFRFGQMNSADTTWNVVAVYALGVAELNTGIICSCKPVIFVLFKSMRKSPTYIRIMRYLRTRSFSAEASEDRRDALEPSPQKLPDIQIQP